MNCVVCGKILVGKQKKFCSRKCSDKEYYSRPEVKEKQRKRIKEYYSRPEVKEKQRKRMKEHRLKEKYGETLVDTFFVQWKHNESWRKEGIERMSELFAETVCDLTKQQKCDLMEKILLKESEKK